MRKTRDESRLEQERRDTEIRRETDVRGSLGAPPSGQEASDESGREKMRGSASESAQRARREGRLPLPD